MRGTVVRPLKRPLKGRREVEALIGERKNHTFDVWIVITKRIKFLLFHDIFLHFKRK